MTDIDAPSDLVEFARLEADSKDVAPWAVILRYALDHELLDHQLSQWITTLYNTFDDYGSAFAFAERWPSLHDWRDDPDRWEAADHATYPIMQERRNLHGGRVIKRMQSYADLVGDQSEFDWLDEGVVGDDPAARFDALCKHTRQVWGVGRQAAFEWAEFQGKVMGHDVHAGHAFLWESEGPRRSLQRLYGNPKPSAQWLDDRASEAQEMLRANGVGLELWDFETVICDFNVMRGGRYYPGKHLAALREEIDRVQNPEYREALDTAWRATIPEPWVDIEPGVDKQMLSMYKQTGELITPFNR